MAKKTQLADCREDTKLTRTSIHKILNKPISRIIVGDDDDRGVFGRAIEVMTEENTSYRVRFVVRMGNNVRHMDFDSKEPIGSIPPTPTMEFDDPFTNQSDSVENKTSPIPLTTDREIEIHSDNESITSSLSLGSLDSELLLEMEGQGILINDSSGRPSHVSFL
jgi:serine/threonine-protein kinase RIM15